ncbi:MAG: hypothetical protein E4H48_10395, partial [Syntrophobacterales bacterium]
IHHGGAGTIAAVLRAGIPSIVLPQILSQATFAEILTEKNLTAGVFDVRTWTPEQLCEAVNKALTDSTLRRAAHAWQHTMQADTGLTTAADLIETHWQEIQNHDC